MLVTEINLTYTQMSTIHMKAYQLRHTKIKIELVEGKYKHIYVTFGTARNHDTYHLSQRGKLVGPLTDDIDDDILQRQSRRK